MHSPEYATAFHELTYAPLEPDKKRVGGPRQLWSIETTKDAWALVRNKWNKPEPIEWDKNNLDQNQLIWLAAHARIF